jgi:transporter family-2 protein
MNYLYILCAFVVGAILTVQAGVNIRLTVRLDSPTLATLASFVIGSVALLAYCLAARIPWPTTSRLATVPWWAWTGGLLGAVYVAGTVILAPRLGAAVFMGLLVAGQMLVALLMDQFGLIGFPVRPVNLTRLFGAALLVAGVVLMQRR